MEKDQSKLQQEGQAAVRAALGRISVGEPTTFGNLSLFPLLDGGCGAPGYLTLDEALAGATAQVTEVSAGGSVPELRFVNEGEKPVLLLDGEELVGAKQNRVLNLTVLVPARTELIIPVSCVEAGRWSARSAEFRTSSTAMFARARAKKNLRVSENLRETGQRRSNQGEVWADVEEKVMRFQAAAPTAAMSDVFAQQALPLDGYLRAFSSQPNQVGALFAIGNQAAGLDLFDCSETLRKLLPKLVRSYALDALEYVGEPLPALPPTLAADFLKIVAAASAESFPALGEGVDVRLTGTGVTGAALVAGGNAIHLSAFCLEERPAAEGGRAQARISRASVRRRHFQGPSEG